MSTKHDDEHDVFSNYCLYKTVFFFAHYIWSRFEKILVLLLWKAFVGFSKFCIIFSKGNIAVGEVSGRSLSEVLPKCEISQGFFGALPTSLTFWLAGLRLLFEPCGSSLLVNSLSVMFILSRLQPTLFNNWMKYPELSPVLGHSTEAASLKCAELAFSQASASCLSSVINPPVNLCQFNSVPVSNDFTNGQLQNLFSWSDQHFQWQKPDGQNICVPHPFSSATV